LNAWLLSFERHAMVGHYTVEMPEEMAQLNVKTALNSN
jgi:hypothetical protein